MTLYLYRIGTSVPVMSLEDVESYTSSRIVMEDGSVCSPLAEDCELSSLPDCSETLRGKWRTENPSNEERVEELETLVVELLFGKSSVNGGEME